MSEQTAVDRTVQSPFDRLPVQDMRCVFSTVLSTYILTDWSDHIRFARVMSAGSGDRLTAYPFDENQLNSNRKISEL